MQQSRRRFLADVAMLPAVLPWLRTLGTTEQNAGPLITSPSSPHNRAFDFSSLTDWITPNSDFFIRSHFDVPRPRSRGAVRVHGSVDRELVLSLDQLERMPTKETPATLECAGNLVGWGGVSNARWTGVSLAAILNKSGVLTGSAEVVFVGADGGSDREAGVWVEDFARSIPLSKALDPSTILATKMNGAPLPAEHGGPIRAIVPGFYGMDSVKWIKEILVSRVPFAGFYQTSRYYESRNVNGHVETETLHRMRIKSQIARPRRRDSLSAGPITLVGAAWSGEARIKTVKLSVNGGATWQQARLGPDDETSAWRLWSLDWSPAPGRYELVARATDDRGDEQPLDRDPHIITPYANNWADRRIVDVR